MENSYTQCCLWWERYDILAWKSMREVTSQILKFTAKKVQMKDVKFQLNIWKLGERFNEFNVCYSKRGKVIIVEDLAQMLK